MHRPQSRRFWIGSTAALAALLLTTGADAKSPFSLVRFIRSKDVAKSSNLLTEDNGPWMIFAAAFAGDGAEADARELVQELQDRYGMKAYLHKQDYDFTEPVVGKGFDMYGNRKRMRFRGAAAFAEYAVLVGDYPSLDDAKLQKQLELLKYAQPDSLNRDLKQGSTTLRFAGLRQFQQRLTGDKKKKQKGPLGKAFATRNPLQSAEDAPVGVDPLLETMNKDREYSLLDCAGKYTVQVAAYRGHVVIDQSEVAAIEDGKNFKSRLDQAGEKAEKLTAWLRQRGVEAYVFHDRHESIVTVGSFQEIGSLQRNGQTELSPAVVKIIETYGPERKPVPGKNGASLTGIQPRTMGGFVLDVAPRPILVPGRAGA